MEKSPFTVAGVQDKQAQLYLLDNQQLTAEANAVATNFNAWMQNNFELSPTQVNYLNNINNRVANFIASQTSFAIANRLPITLIKPENRMMAETAPTEDSKLIRPKSNLSASTDADGNYTATGDLTIEISYE